MNIFIREIRANIKSLFLWCIGMIAMIGGGMGKFVGYVSSGVPIDNILSIFPRSLLNIMGISNFDLSTIIGFYGVLFLYLLLIAATHAVMLGANIIAKEEQDKTTEFLFTKPVSRSNVVTSKLLAALLNIVILNIVTFIALLISASYFDESCEILVDIIMLMVGMLIIQLIFVSIGSLLASVIGKPKAAVSTASSILLITFMIYILTNISGKLEKLRYFTPFKYFEAEAIILGDGIDIFYIILSATIIGVLIIGTYRFYQRRDLNV